MSDVDAVLVWRDPILRYARQHQIDPSFGAGIILIESSGNPNAGLDKYQRNPDGSWVSVVPYAQGVGLTQVIPVEAPGNWSGRPSVGQLLDPEFAIDYGFGILADNLHRCGTKEGAACAYFSGHCVPTGASDPNASDFQYIAKAMAAEWLFLDLNGQAAEDDDEMIPHNGIDPFFEHANINAGPPGVMQCRKAFNLPAAATWCRLEVFIQPGSPGRLVFEHGDAPAGAPYAGQAGDPWGFRSVIDVKLDAAGACRFRVEGAPSVRTIRIGVLGQR